jgi:hypothetical protein
MFFFKHLVVLFVASIGLLPVSHLLMRSAHSAESLLSHLDADLQTSIVGVSNDLAKRVTDWYRIHESGLTGEQANAVRTRFTIAQAIDQLAQLDYLTPLQEGEMPPLDALQLLGNILDTLRSFSSVEATDAAGGRLDLIARAVADRYAEPLLQRRERAELKPVAPNAGGTLVGQFASAVSDGRSVTVFDLSYTPSPPLLIWSLKNFDERIASEVVSIKTAGLPIATAGVRTGSGSVMTLYIDLSDYRDASSALARVEKISSLTSGKVEVIADRISDRLLSCAESTSLKTSHAERNQARIAEAAREGRSVIDLSKPSGTDSASEVPSDEKGFVEQEEARAQSKAAALAACRKALHADALWGRSVLYDARRMLVAFDSRGDVADRKTLDALVDDAVYLAKIWPK